MKIKTLTVDNNPVLLKAISTILEQEGCEVQQAATGLEALEALHSFDPEIVFTDLIMPEVSGEQLCRLLRRSKKYKHIFIVVLSAIVLEDRERIQKEVDCDLCIAKGNLKEIRTQLRGALQTFSEHKESSRKERKVTARIPQGLKPSEVAGELLKEKLHLSTILGNLDEGILELNQDGKIISANQAALTVLDKKEEQLTGAYLPEAANWGEFTSEIAIWTKEQLIAKKIGNLEIYENKPLTIGTKVITGSFLPVFDGGNYFGLCILRDISRQYYAEKHNKELDNAIRLVKKMDAMSIMAGGVAHDFNNLLTVICGNLDIISFLGTDQDPKENLRLIEQARNAALVAVDLTRQISCFSNFGIVSRETVLLDELVSNAVKEFFQDRPTDFQLQLSEKQLSVSIDPEEIVMAIHSVLQNAMEAEPNDEITISVHNNTFEKPQLITGQYVPAGSYARIDIEDNGRGIDKEELFKIFDPYFSSKQRGAMKGMGLGLTVVYATLRNHGGYVVVQSEEGKGAQVSLFLPLQFESTVLRKEEQFAPANYDIVLMEPDIQMREIGKIMLEHLGFNVHLSEHMEAVLELAGSLREENTTSPLVILDVSDSTGESAIDTCKALLEQDPAIKVVAMSGTILDPVMEDCQQYGFTNALSKPYTMDSLRHIIMSVLRS